MKFKYHVTTEVQKWWDKQNFGPIFKEKLENCLSSTDELRINKNITQRYGCYFIVRFPGHSRPTFLWEAKTRGNAVLYVLRVAGVHNDYNKGYKIDAWIEKFPVTATEEIEISNVLSQMESNDDNSTDRELSPLSDSEYGFISNPLTINHKLFEETIYETEEWVECVKNEKDFSDFYNSAEVIENYIVEHINDADGWQKITFKDKIIFVYHDGKDWVLADIKKYDKDEDYSSFFTKGKPTVYRRGYPWTFLGDKDEWRDMELEKKSNMVLSEEQVKIVSSDIQYPLFITGRAGSGKSTALQYLFAEIILRYVLHKIQDDGNILPPVYLSYSENLITDAKGLSLILLQKNSEYKEQIKSMGINLEEDVMPEFDSMFYVFQSLVKQCIKVHDKDYLTNHFLAPKYISFAKFNKLWNQRFSKVKDAAKKYGPSESWHVIRTYIKGWDGEHLLTPETYKLIPRDDKTVSEETFTTIYEKVWEAWYSDFEAQGYWDDQDLVRHCLDNGYASEQFSAIFCDESQDFTRIELDFIMKVSSFANRKISNVSDIKRLPFVFAGDEFQTLNPTGFSWRSLRGYFSTHLCELVGLKDQINNVRLEDPVELSENFRSTRQVVKLANRIQLLRATRFGEESKPQSTHFPKEGHRIVCLSPDDNMVFDELSKKGVILIVPAADGESVEEFITNSPLNGKIKFEGGSPVGITILNPTQAKGLEYPNVAIYGFECKNEYSNLSMNSLVSWYDKKKDYHVTQETDIDLKYHISNAYVAVTRAGTKLFIIDKFDRSSFWSFAFNHSNPDEEKYVQNLEQKMLNTLSPNKRQLWPEDGLGWINPGSATDITDENIDYLNKEENMNALEKRAESLMDVGLMRQAASRHKEANRKIDEHRCRAKAFMYEENYSEAAEHFSKANMFEESLDNYWQSINAAIEGKTSKDIIPGTITKIARLYDKIRCAKVELCKLVNTKPSLVELNRILDEVCTLFSQNDSELMCRAAWQHIINLVIPKLNFSNATSVAMETTIKKRDELKPYKIILDSAKLALMAYERDLTDSAIMIWEEMEKTQRPVEYYRAKVDTLSYPRNIEFMEASQRESWRTDILSEYHKNKETVLNDYQKNILCNVVRYEKSEEDFKELLPCMLRAALTTEATNNILNEAVSVYKMENLNQDVIKAVLSAKLTDLNTWTAPKTKYADAKARELLDAIAFLRRIRNTDYINRSLGPQLPSKELNSFCTNTMRHYAQRSFSPLLYIEVGKVIEARNNFIESRNYYQNIRSMYDDPTFRREADLRIVLFLDRIAELKNDDRSAVEAVALRRTLKLNNDYVIPTTSSVSSYDWELLINYAMTISNEIAPEREKRKRIGETKTEDNEVNPVEEKNDVPAVETTTKTVEQPVVKKKPMVPVVRSAAKQTFKYGNYELSYTPRKNEIIIHYQNGDDDYTAKVKKGVLAESDEYQLIDGRLYFTEIDHQSPFVLNLSDTSQIVEIYDGENPTGLAFTVKTED